MLQAYTRGDIVVLVDSSFYVVKSSACNFACGYKTTLSALIQAGFAKVRKESR